MVSFRGKLFRFFLRGTNNLNPVNTPDTLKKVEKMSRVWIGDGTPRGFVMTKEQTPNGTAFQRVVKKGGEKNGRVLLYLHGGAYIGGLLSFYRKFAPWFHTATGGAELILLDYKCAPQHTYPSQLNEALDLWEDLIGRQGYAEENIVVGGDSAGAHLTLSLLLKLRDTGRKMPRGGFCISAWADMEGMGKSFTENYPKDIMFGEKGKPLTEEKRERLRDCALFSFVGGADRYDPYVSPVYGDYHGFPPMFFTVGGDEMLLDDTMRIVENLRKNDVSAEYDLQEGMFHIYTLYCKFIPEAKKSFDKVLEFLQTRFQE